VPMIMSWEVGSWIQLLVVHTGCLVMDRVHVASPALPTAAAAAAVPGLRKQHQQLKSALHRQQHVLPAQDKLTTGFVRRKHASPPDMGKVHQHGQASRCQLATDSKRGSSTLLLPPSSAQSVGFASRHSPGLLSFSMAEALVLGVGGKVTVSHPVPMVNACSGQVDSATCIEIMLPACFQG
jgi:hypothetical protein